MRLSIIALGLCVASCASDKYRPHTTEWDDDDDDVKVVRAPEPEKAGPKKVTARELADKFRTAEECEAQALEHYKRDPKAAVVLLNACVDRPDFIELAALLKAPWKGEIRAEPRLHLMIAEVSARRGGFVERDTFLARAAGIPIYDVTSALALKDGAIGKLVLVRGAVTKVADEKWGGGTATVATIAESSWSDLIVDENKAPEPKDELEQRTGRLVFARIERKDDRFAPQKQLVFVLRHEAKRTHKDPTSDDELNTIFGKLVAAYDAAPTLPP